MNNEFLFLADQIELEIGGNDIAELVAEHSEDLLKKNWEADFIRREYYRRTPTV